ncbi:adenylate/guanylate cyclase domain-containing protein [Rhizobium sp. PL01]|uniref:adenylate/guanylate cyclase domain-containing protein n=1 Tax=Rhizobium sp. PL01 TaxID=3085631 RepID=UPI002981A70A|nr:adenylate/guanylate cyclase domain-containing protein [Rhizobium sp. PL01]MDW5318481.1 adenylate/guanylate cyclase domain-containing protein [Rhizobium sp. PL01]
MHLDEERTLTVLTQHRTIIDKLIEAAKGQIFGTAGDSVLAEFPSVVQAFNCAIAIQRALTRANADIAVDERMLLRIGINVGDVMVKGGDIFGDGVNIAARLEALSDPGGVCVTRGVRDHLRDRVEAKFEDLGEHSVKNIARPVRVFRVDFDMDAATDRVDASSPLEEPAPASSGLVIDETEIMFWQSVQTGDQTIEYEIYLQRYPDGEFAELAKARLSQPRTESDPAIEVSFWESVRSSNNAVLLETYLDKFPVGEFTEIAKVMLSGLSKPDGS